MVWVLSLPSGKTERVSSSGQLLTSCMPPLCCCVDFRQILSQLGYADPSKRSSADPSILSFRTNSFAASPTLLFSVEPPVALWLPGLSFPNEVGECVGPHPKGVRRRDVPQGSVAAAGVICSLLFAGGIVTVQAP